jgi:hypothetical protein
MGTTFQLSNMKTDADQYPNRCVLSTPCGMHFHILTQYIVINRDFEKPVSTRISAATSLVDHEQKKGPAFIAEPLWTSPSVGRLDWLLNFAEVLWG